MKRYFSTALVIATLGASLLAGTPAHAATIVVTECTFSLNLTFDPPLIIGNNNGIVDSYYGAACNDVYDDGRIVGRTDGPFTGRGSYTGGCHFLTFSGPLVGFMAGGALLVSVSSNSSHLLSVAEWTVLPNQICNESSASGALGSFSAAFVTLYPR